MENDDEEGHVLATMMNMTQLAFIKRLDCVERVKTNEGMNPFLAEEAVKLTPSHQSQREDEILDDEVEMVITDIDPETLEVQTEIALNRPTDANLESVAIAETDQMNNGVAVASVATSSRSSCSCCPTNTDMASAQEINVGSLIDGYICCPGSEQWFKFTVPQDGTYTIYTIGSLDTVGTLYDCCGNPIITVDNQW